MTNLKLKRDKEVGRLKRDERLNEGLLGAVRDDISHSQRHGHPARGRQALSAASPPSQLLLGRGSLVVVLNHVAEHQLRHRGHFLQTPRAPAGIKTLTARR